jgi:hypothetical protein
MVNRVSDPCDEVVFSFCPVDSLKFFGLVEPYLKPLATPGEPTLMRDRLCLPQITLDLGKCRAQGIGILSSRGVVKCPEVPHFRQSERSLAERLRRERNSPRPGKSLLGISSCASWTL